MSFINDLPPIHGGYTSETIDYAVEMRAKAKLKAMKQSYEETIGVLRAELRRVEALLHDSDMESAALEAEIEAILESEDRKVKATEKDMERIDRWFNGEITQEEWDES